MTRFLESPRGRVLTSLVLSMFTFTSVAGQDYVWQIERLKPDDNSSIQVGFEPGDLAFSWLDIPPMFFPLQITAVDVLYDSQFDSVHTVASTVALFDNQGYPRYFIDGATRTDGLIRALPPSQCTGCEFIFNDGPIAVADQFLGEFIDGVDEGIISPLRQDSSHIVTASDGCWPGYNSVYDWDTETWLDVCPGLNGNFTFRPHFVLLCPERIGDIDGDEDIDFADLAIFTNYMAGPDFDQWISQGVLVDHDNDYDVDLADFSIFQNNFTAGANVGCPVFPMPQAASTGTSYPAFPIDQLGSRGTTDFMPYASFGLERAHQPDGPSGATQWTLIQVAAVVGITAAIVSVSLVIGPCVAQSCRDVNATLF